MKKSKRLMRMIAALAVVAGTSMISAQAQTPERNKSAFDLLLDLIIKSKYYSNTVFCIDEPEAHMHTRLQSKLLAELYRLIPEHSQLWVSTHSIGMLKQAEELELANPNSVTF